MWRLICLVVLVSTCAQAAPTVSTTKSQIVEKKVGVILPLTGNAASYGEQFKKGVELALEGKDLKVIYEDSKFDSQTALTAYRKLTSVDRIDFLISFGGATCEVLNNQAQRNKLVHLAAGCNTAKFDSSNSYNFRMDVNEAIAAEKMASFLVHEGVKSIAFVYVENGWAETIVKFTKEAFINKQLKVTDIITFKESGGTDLRSELVKLKNHQPDRIFLISLPDLTPTVLKQIREIGIKSPIVSNISVENPEVIKLAGKNAEGITYLSVKNGRESKLTHPKFYTIFPEGNPFAAWGFDSINLVLLIRVSNNPRDKLISLNNYVGAFSLYNFKRTGELELPYEIREIKDNGYVHYADL